MPPTLGVIDGRSVPTAVEGEATNQKLTRPLDLVALDATLGEATSNDATPEDAAVAR